MGLRDARYPTARVSCLLVSCLFNESVEQVDLPGEAEIGLELADAVGAGVRTAEMQTQTPVAQRIIFETEALEVDFLARDDILVEGFGVGQLGLIVVVAGLGEDNPFLSDVDADAEVLIL